VRDLLGCTTVSPIPLAIVRSLEPVQGRTRKYRGNTTEHTCDLSAGKEKV